jgi:hypothetical protein
LLKDTNGVVKKIILKNANPDNFKIISKISSGNFCSNKDIWARDSMNVYYKFHKILGADPVSFKVLNDGYSKDNNKVYFREKLVFSADAETIKPLGDFYAKDKNKIWFFGKRIIGNFKLKSFEIIDGYFSKDISGVYLNNDTILNKIPNSDYLTFKEIQQNSETEKLLYKYYSDVNKIYFIDTEKNVGEEDFFYTIKANIKTFEIINKKYYTKDSLNIYYKAKNIKGVDIVSFKTLGADYSLDKNSVYYQNKRIYDSDVLSFKVSNSENYDAADNINFYLKGKKIILKD